MTSAAAGSDHHHPSQALSPVLSSAAEVKAQNALRSRADVLGPNMYQVQLCPAWLAG
jgi:hypothetical protein